MAVTLHGSVADIVQKEVSSGKYQSPEDLVFEALEALVKHKTDEGINEGLADIEAGRCMDLTPDNIDEVLNKPLSQW